MPKTVYACNWVEKTAEVDNYEKGCDPDTHVCVMSEGADITADSLKGLVEAIGKSYYLDIDDVFIPGDEDEPVTRIGFNRTETVDGDEPTKHELSAWKKGKLTLYLADYHFGIEKRTIESVSQAEFVQAGIKTH